MTTTDYAASEGKPVSVRARCLAVSSVIQSDHMSRWVSWVASARPRHPGNDVVAALIALALRCGTLFSSRQAKFGRPASARSHSAVASADAG